MSTSRAVRATVVPVVRAVLWLGLLLAGHLGLTAAGQTLPSPPLPWPPEVLLTWIEANDVALTSFSLLRVVGLVIIWYLALLTVLVLLARVSGLRPLAFLAHRLALPWARQLLNHALGAGLAVTLAGGVVPLAGATSALAAPAPIAVAIDRADASTAASTPTGGTVTMSVIDDTGDQGDTGVTMRALPDEAGESSVTMQELPADHPEAQPVGGSIARATVSMHLLDDADAPAPTWTIASGDHLWHVAATTLASHWGRAPTSTETTAYWHQLIDHNRSRLAVPDDPDLVYPGQVFELPPVPPAGG